MIDRASALRSAALRRVLTRSGSSSALPIVWRGLSEPYGFWNTIWISRLRRFRVAALACATSSPSISSEPAVGFSIRVRSRASVDLPDPDSPTTASVRPACNENDTPDRALIVARERNAPRETE